MPYCPKCDMEFVEGVAVCSDCGRPLLASKQEAAALKQKEEEALALLRRDQEARAAEAAVSAEAEYRGPAAARIHPYVKQSQKQEDLRSSAAAFAIMALILGTGSAALGAGLLPVSLTGASRIFLPAVMGVMAAGCLLVTVSSLRSARSAGDLAEEEEKRTSGIIRAFLASHTGEELDRQLEAETGELSFEELSLKRFELIQDILVTTHDLPDPAYVDALSEELYGRLYETPEA